MNTRSLTAGLAGLALLGLWGPVAEGERAKRSTAISLAAGDIDTTKAIAAVPVGLGGAASPGGEEVVLVQFPGPVTAAQLDALERRVERVYTYLPDDAFLVRVSAGHRQRLKDAGVGLAWSGPYHPAYKISPALAAVASGDGKSGKRRSVLIHVYPDARLDEVVDKIAFLAQGEMVAAKQKDRFSRIRLLLTADEIVAARDELARLAEVFFLDLEPRRVLKNDTTVWVAQSGTDGGRQTPVHDRGIFGQRQVIAVLDTGIDADMCYFRDPDRGLPPQNVCDGGTAVDRRQRKVIAVDFLWSAECAGGIAPDEWDTHDHGTHVAGIAAGDDFANPLSHDPGDGLAPGAKLVIQDGGVRTDDCADLPGLGCPVVDLNPLFLQAYRQGARIHSNSWGDDENNPTGGLYSAGSEDADEFAWNHKDFLAVFAAGNSGPGVGTALSPATGKNVVAAGATLRGTGAEGMASFSSCGPTADGRVKPDVTMPGASILSADADNDVDTMNCNLRSASGTSMATPGVAGALALIRQYFTAGFYPSGAAVAADEMIPSAALLKAVLVNSGHDMADVAPIPADCQGWGRVLLDDALHFRGQARRLLVEDDNPGFARGSSGEERRFELFVERGEPLEVTLVWTDFPSTPAAARNLVNDLDLVVTGPGGTFRGNVFAGGASRPGGAADRRNNVEQVLLENPAAGAYTVTVRSFNVPQGPQPFALVVTGALGQCVADGDCDDGLACNGEEACVAGGCSAGTPVDCAAGDLPAGALCLGGDRFCVESRWADFSGGSGRGTGTALTSDSGTFWFFDPANVELIVKVLDACVPPFDRFWVFAAGLTNLGVELAVTDVVSGEVVAYVNPAGSAFEPIQDTSAFDTCDAAVPPVAPESILRQLESRLAGEGLPPAAGANAVGQGSETCTPGPTSLCLAGGRFRIEARWETAAGDRGDGRAFELSGDTGYFWFFGPDNVEVVVKVLDACVAPFDHFWVFAAGLTNVAVTLRVTDTVSGEVREYENPLGAAFQPIQDTEAFATCG